MKPIVDTVVVAYGAIAIAEELYIMYSLKIGIFLPSRDLIRIRAPNTDKVFIFL